LSERPNAIERPGDVIRQLIMAAGAAVFGTAAMLALLLSLVNHPDWWQGLLAATMVALLTAAVSLPPLAIGLQRGLTGAVSGFFIAAGAKVLVSIGSGCLAILAGGYPALPTMVLIVVYYLALLAVQSAIIARAIWSTSA
jgi:hypothetical protein